MSDNEMKRGIHGFKASEFMTVEQAKEKLGDESPAEELPEGVRLYIREKLMRVPTGAKIACNLYRLVDEGGQKDVRKWIAKLPPRVPEDDEVAVYGGGRYIWIMKWALNGGRETGILSDPVVIDESIKVASEKPLGVPPAAPPQAIQAGATSFGFSPGDIIKIMDQAEEKALARMERMSAMFHKQAGPAEVMADAYKASTEMMAASVKMTVDMGKQISGKVKEKLNEEDEEEGGDVETGLGKPATWVEQIIPHIKPYMEKLLGGGPSGAAVKSFILGSEQWKEIFGDREKWGIFVAAAEQEFGSDTTARALKILLNERDKKDAKKKGRA